MINVDYVKLYKTFVELQNPENDLDVIEYLSDNLAAYEKVAKADLLAELKAVSDDTTQAKFLEAKQGTKELIKIATPLVDDFLGISEDDRKKLSQLLPKLLVSYGIILYKTYGYEIIAAQYSMDGKIDLSSITLPPELLEEVTKDLPKVVETINTILAAFKMFRAYFAEYQIADQQDLYDVIAQLEDQDYSASEIGRISEAKVRQILADAGY